MKNQTKAKYQWIRAALAVVTLGMVFFTCASIAATVQDTGTYHYKMISSLEYSGKGQYKSRTESLFAVNKESLSADKSKYSIWTDDVSPASTDSDSSGFGRVSFVLDRANREILTNNGSLSFFQTIHNHCAQSLEKVARNNIMKKLSSNELASIIAPASLPIKIGSIVEKIVDIERSTISQINCFLDFDQYLKIIRAEFM